MQEALSKLQSRQKKLDVLAREMDETNATQCCETEPEAKRMRSGRDGIVVGYNIQTAVEDETGLIVHHDVTDEGGDNRQLEPMAKSAQAELEKEELIVLADAGYSNGEQLADCEEAGIEPFVPPNRTVNNKGDFYQKHDFQYDKDRDLYICPVGKELHYETYHSKNKMKLYARTGCQNCPLQSRCTKADKRWISRHFYEEALERTAGRVRENPHLMRRRSAVVERPFAHLKQIMGLRRFQCWGKEGAKAEMGLGVLAYNLNRMINEVGAQKLISLI